MTPYDIYVLDERDISLSDGAQLDGVTQGDGSHLNGVTITFNTSNWKRVSIMDDDADFQDNDGSQTLAKAHTIDGTAYSSGTVVEAEFGFTVTDGTNTWTMVGFNARDSNPAYGTVEGVAVIESTQGFPPVGTPLQIIEGFEFPSFAARTYQQPTCFASHTLIDTPDGPRPVEALAPGMTVLTRDHGASTVLWTGHRAASGHGRFSPVRIAAGVFDNDEPVFVSQEHRILVSDWRADYFFGEDEILVPAKKLTGLPGVDICPRATIGYHHLLLQEHAALRTHGIWSESIWLGRETMLSLLPTAKAEIRSKFPELLARTSVYRFAKGFEANVFRAAA